MPTSLVDTLIEHTPRLYPRRDGVRVSFSVSPSLLRYLDGTLHPGMRTLETGAGVSTILFLAKGCQHTAIAPSAGLHENIRAWCGEAGIEAGGLTFHDACSEAVLPGFDAGELDLVLIDGRHAFPTPFIDWYYTAPKLKVGGVLVVDDTHLWAPRVLSAFLRCEGEWEFVTQLERRTAVFRKRAEGSHGKYWQDQPYGAVRSRTRARNLLHAFDLLRAGRLGELGRLFRRR